MQVPRRRYHHPGTAPGTYDVERTRRASQPAVRVIDYDSSGIAHHEGLAAVSAPRELHNRWIHVAGAPSLEVLALLEERFDIDPLILEDVVNTGQRPKLNDFDPYLFLTLSLPLGGETTRFEQLSLYLGDGLLISFLDNPSDLLKPIEERLKRESARVRREDSHYLLYAILDLTVDLFFPVVDASAQQLESLEDEILNAPTERALMATHHSRNRLLMVRKVAWATREVVSELLRHWDSEEAQSIRPFLQDTYDHTVAVIDLVETQRDIATNLVEVYLSVISNRMNEVIKLLTLIATLFIPGTFIASLYGMNFDRGAGPLSMPELDWPFGYLGVLVVIGLSMLGMLLYFRHKRWL